MMQIQSPFLWGSNGEKLTPEQVARRHAQADEKLKGVGDTSPVGHWLQGAGRVVNAITGKIQERRADASEQMGMDGADAYVRNDPVLSGLLGGGTAPATAGTPSTGQMPQGVNADSIRAGLVARGLPEHVADGFVMNFQDESGLNPGINEAAPIVPGSRGGFGLAQWTGPRRKALESFAAERGVSVADPDIQLDFLMTELQGPESGAANSILSAADSGQAAAAIVNKFLRPAEEHRASREARYTGGGGMSASGQPMPITGGGEGVVGALASAMSDPWVAKKYGPVIQSLMSQQMARGDMQYQQQLQQSDPQYQLGLQKSQLELDAMRNPAAPAPIEINGQLVDPVTRKVLGDYRTPETPEVGYHTLTPDEVAAEGLPAGAYQRGGDGKIVQIGGGGVTVNNDMGGDEFETAFAKGDAATVGAISESGMAAQRNFGRIDQLEKLLAVSPTGMQGAIKQVAGEWGINTEGLTEIQSATALINSLVPEQRQPGSGPMSDADLALFKQSLPRIINQPGGNEIIIQTMRAIAQYDAEGAQIVQKMRLPADQGGITRAQAFDELLSRKNPLDGFKLPAATQSVGAPVADQPIPDDLTPEEKAILGIE